MSSEILPADTAQTSWLRWGGTLLAIALLIYLLSQQGWDEIFAAARQIAWWRFILALTLVLISRTAVSGRWYTLMHSAGTGISIRHSLRLTFAMLFSSNFLPTTIGGDVIRLAGAIRLGYDQAVAIASLVMDRLVGMAGMATALPFGIHSYIQTTFVPGSTGVVASAWAQPLVNKMKDFSQKLTCALVIWLQKPRALLIALAFTWVHMLCTFSAVYLLLEGMGETISFWLLMGLWSAAYFVTLLPISINGMGIQELALTYFFVTFGGISPSGGLAMALLMRILQMLASLPGVLFIPDILAGKR